MGDLLFEEAPPLFAAGEKVDGALDVAGLEGPTAHDGEVFAGDDVGVEFDIARVGVLAEDEVFAAVAAEFEAFGDGAGVADAFEDDIGAVFADKGADSGEAGAGGGVFGEIDHAVGAEFAGHAEAVGGAADDDDAGGAAFARDGEGGEADGAGTLDDDGVAHFDADAFDALEGGVEGAASADDGFKRDFVREAEDGGAGAEKDPLAVAAAEVGGFLAAVGDAVGFAFEAAGGGAFDTAVVAFAADDGTGPDDAVADGEGLALPVAVEAGAEFGDAAGAFVAEDDGDGDGEFALPEVDVGAADAGHFDAGEGLAGGEVVVEGEFADFEGGLEGGEDGGFGEHDRILLNHHGWDGWRPSGTRFPQLVRGASRPLKRTCGEHRLQSPQKMRRIHVHQLGDWPRCHDSGREKRNAGRHALDGMGSGLPGASHRWGTGCVYRRVGRGTIVGAHAGNPAQRAAAEGY